MRTITLDRAWRLALHQAGLSADEVARKAGLPVDLLSRDPAVVSVDAYRAMWEAVEGLGENDPALAVRLGAEATPELFSPVLFAALCSGDLCRAMERIQAHKPLVSPQKVDLRHTPLEFGVSWRWPEDVAPMPALEMAAHAVLVTQLARTGTRERIAPVAVTMPRLPKNLDALADFLGTAPTAGPAAVVFRAQDARRPFLTASEAMWTFFEGEFRRRSEPQQQASTVEQVRTHLLECLPAAEASIDAVAARMAVSRRTLQRLLAAEGTIFRDVVRDVREELARRYLCDTSVPLSEIAFLLGYGEVTSFIRAFRSWTGSTPQRYRGVRRHDLAPGARRTAPIGTRSTPLPF
ncbi:helix-turn-helix domain-containing protein [Streptomyces sp. NPDC059168]|uniref:AraC family transcriptional regulator n=1 Tax=Streptomyces sp. NPDC059168 TaxID=3346753 RepID=UPI0036CD68AD